MEELPTVTENTVLRVLSVDKIASFGSTMLTFKSFFETAEYSIFPKNYIEYL